MTQQSRERICGAIYSRYHKVVHVPRVPLLKTQNRVIIFLSIKNQSLQSNQQQYWCWIMFVPKIYNRHGDMRCGQYIIHLAACKLYNVHTSTNLICPNRYRIRKCQNDNHFGRTSLKVIFQASFSKWVDINPELLSHY